MFVTASSTIRKRILKLLKTIGILPCKARKLYDPQEDTETGGGTCEYVAPDRKLYDPQEDTETLSIIVFCEVLVLRKLYDPQEDTETDARCTLWPPPNRRKLYDPQEDTETDSFVCSTMFHLPQALRSARGY